MGCCDKKRKIFIPSKYKYLCSNHFKDYKVYGTYSGDLKDDAILQYLIFLTSTIKKVETKHSKEKKHS